ncbi:BZ3500_MvSof-1268-A1-R1_Chr10-1g02725 [Microbotryum saponariae]|uniref:DNA (cytosine-5-)-methyltransferase n=1 Tax=Microbotryum saponariae TaxID=289078 RepID=A0A2X0LGR5_9BASI|nr:BZ3500_MvSof-1268-A1-R1_Chr10-1g02725 [Microbotryum saponariae]SDA06214.1 BZ3501_MvSof-1269-A2-R1_Chr10-1g02326 [Microbotryum saponariae]
MKRRRRKRTSSELGEEGDALSDGLEVGDVSRRSSSSEPQLDDDDDDDDDEHDEQEIEPPLALPPLPALAPSETSSPIDARRQPHLRTRDVSPSLGAPSPVASTSTRSVSAPGRSPTPTPPESAPDSDGVSEFGIDSGRRPLSAIQPGRGHHRKYYIDEELDQEYRAFERACQAWLKAHHKYPQYRLFESIKVRLSDLIKNRWRWWKGVSNYERLAYFEDRKWPNQKQVTEIRHRVGPKAIDLTIEDSDDESDAESRRLRELEWQDPDEASAPIELNEFGHVYSGDAFINDPQRFIALPTPPPTLEERLARYQRETARVEWVRKREKKRRRVEPEKGTTPGASEPRISPILEPTSPQQVPELMDLEYDVESKSVTRTRAKDKDAARAKSLVTRQQAASRTKRRKRIDNPRPRRLFGIARKKKTVPGRRPQSSPDRKPLLPQADPTINEFHEYHLFELFEIPLPTTRKTKGAFAMRDFALYSKRVHSRSMSDLLLLDGSNKSQFDRLEFEGWVLPEVETLPESGRNSADDGWVEFDRIDLEWETRGDRIPHEFDGLRKVVIAASDIVGLVPRLERNTGRPCLYLVTKLGSYRLETPDESYRKGHHLDRASIFINLFVFGRENHVLGQNNRPIRDLVADLKAKLYDFKLVKATMAALERLPPTYQLPKPWSSYANPTMDLGIAHLLHRHLVNTPFVTPVVYNLVAPFLEPKSVRTDEKAVILGRRAQANSAAAVELQEEMEQAILDWWEDNSDPEITLEGTGVQREHPDRADGVEGDGVAGSRITVYDCMRVDANVFKVGDTVLVAGTRTDGQNGAEDASAIERARREAQRDDQEGDWYDDGPPPSFPTKALPAKLWYAKIVYFFADNDDVDPEPDIKAHVSWLIPLCDTPLGSLAPKRALCYNDHCSTISATTIARKINIVELDHCSGVPPPTGLYYSLHWDRHTNNYVDSHPVEYLSGPKAFERCEKVNIERCSSCERRIEEYETSFFDPKTELSTDRAAWIEDSPIPAFKVGQNTYHLGDYCYLIPLGSEGSTNKTNRREPYLLGQLIGVGNVKLGDRPKRLPPFDNETYLQVRALLRYDDVSDKNLVFGKRDFDERRLVLTDIVYDGFYWSNLEGTFRLETWKEVKDQAGDTFATDTGERDAIVLAALQQRQDVFYAGRGLSFLEVDEDTYWSLARNWVSSACNDIELGEKNVLRTLTADEIDDIARCPECDRQHQLDLQRQAYVAETTAREPVRYALGALSAYSGVDLLSIGLERGCSVIKTKAAIEQNPYAAAALKANGQKVFNCPTSDYVEALYYSQSVPVQDGDKPTRPAPLRRGEVHLIQSGPPCQGFSSQNQCKTQDDVRCLEPFVWLSAVEQYRPLFAVFENVSDIQRFILPRGSEEEAVEKGGLLRLLMSALIQLGYQVRLDVHQAAAFGTPQGRQRVILMCARRGLLLPAAPQPTHAFTDNGLKTFAAPYETGTKIHTARSSLRRGGHAPHHAVTIEAAINDLPSFGFADAFDLTPAGEADFAWEQYQPIGFRSRQEVLEQDHKAKSFYASKYPKSSFQRSLRVRTTESHNTALTPETSEHVVPAVPEIHASYFANIAKRSMMKNGRVPGKSHNYRDIPLEVTIEFEDGVEQSFALRPELPSAMQDEDKRSRDPEHFWARLEWTQVISTLLTQLQPAGYWHGPRIHPVDNRQLSVRETARLFGCPDHIKLEAVGRADDEDERFDEMYKLVGNAVPVPLAEAIGRELLRVVDAMICEAGDAPSEPDALCDQESEGNFFAAIWTKLEAAEHRQRLDHDATTCSAEKTLVFGGEGSDGSDNVVSTVIPKKQSKTSPSSAHAFISSRIDKPSMKIRGSGSQSRS